MTAAVQEAPAARGITVVIPTFNMAAFLPRLWATLVRSGVADVAREVLFVNDGSTDDTAEVIDRLAADPAPIHRKIRHIRLVQNMGRFRARYEGAKAARGDRLLFLDSRIELPDDFGARLAEAAAEHVNVMGIVDIDTRRSVFSLYWDRSHRLIFWRHYRDTRQPLTLTPENYDRYLKGTGVLLCSRKRWIAACEAFRETALLSDDTYLLREVVRHEPITIDPRVRVHWMPRETTGAFLMRLWERGPSFVEYHVFARRGPFFWAVLTGLVALAAWAALLVTRPLAGLALAGGSLLAVAASTALLAKSPIEILRLAPLHVAVVAVFGAAILRGIGTNLMRWWKGTFPR